MKKLIAFLSASLMLIAVAAPALAVCGSCPQPGRRCCPAVEINNNNQANVVTTADSNSNTGANRQMDIAMFSGGSDKIVTGRASSNAWAVSGVNSNVNMVKVKRLSGPIEINNYNRAGVRTVASVDSNTGRNSQMDIALFSCGGDVIRTGRADSYSLAESYVNSNENTVRSWGTWMMH